MNKIKTIQPYSPTKSLKRPKVFTETTLYYNYIKKVIKIKKNHIFKNHVDVQKRQTLLSEFWARLIQKSQANSNYCRLQPKFFRWKIEAKDPPAENRSTRPREKLTRFGEIPFSWLTEFWIFSRLKNPQLRQI